MDDIATLFLGKTVLFVLHSNEPRQILLQTVFFELKFDFRSLFSVSLCDHASVQDKKDHFLPHTEMHDEVLLRE